MSYEEEDTCMSCEEEDTYLPELQPIDHRRDTSLHMRVGKLYQLFVHKVIVAQRAGSVVHELGIAALCHVLKQPRFAPVSVPRKGKHEGVIIARTRMLHIKHVPRQVCEVLLALLRRARAQTFVILDPPLSPIYIYVYICMYI